MRTRILDLFQKATNPVVDFLTPTASSIATVATSSLTTLHAAEPRDNHERVAMKSTNKQSTSGSTIMKRLSDCASKNKQQPEIFIALLEKQKLQPEQVEKFAVELARNGKARELDALAGKYDLSREFVTNTLREANKPETYQELLEAREEIKNIGYLFDPNNSVTIVEASDKDSIVAATLAARSITGKTIIRVDTTDEYSPRAQVDVVQRQERIPDANQPRLFKTYLKQQQDSALNRFNSSNDNNRYGYSLAHAKT